MNTKLNGITFGDLPYIKSKSMGSDGLMVKGEEVTVVREVGKPWDSEGRPAYSVRLGLYHLGYIPLVETIKEEYIRAKDGYRKIYKDEFQAMSTSQLREYAKALNEKGETEVFHDWEFVGKDLTRKLVRSKWDECCAVEDVRNNLYTDIMRNHRTPIATLLPAYFDKEEGLNFEEIGEICSLSVRFDYIN